LSSPEPKGTVLARKATEDARVVAALTDSREISDEIIGFHAQQALEKWLKAVIAFRGLREERVHDIGRLLQILEKAGVELPERAEELDELTIYAMPLRYGELIDLEPLDRDAISALLDDVGTWAKAQLGQ
jgi:HEPN domain-containing protein